MPSKNSLSAIKKRNTNILKTADQKQPDINKTQRIGRKPKPSNEKEYKTVVLKITEEEYSNLQNNAGLIPLGTYVKDHIRNKTTLLK